MRADPSGAVELGEAIGREADVERLWTALRTEGVILTARFGVGKTTLARLALAHAPAGWAGERVELDGVATGADACARIVEALGSGADTGLRDALETACAESSGFVLILDDFDRWLRAVTQADPDGFATLTTSLATTLAELPTLRLVLISDTRIDRHFASALASTEAPTGVDALARLRRVALDSLSPESGARLVMALVLGESITARDRAAFGRILADRCDHVPRWIHAAMAFFVARGRPIAEGDVERCLLDAAANPERPPWSFGPELAAPLDEYPQPQRGLAFSLLDQIAVAEDHALTFADLRQQLAMAATIDDDAIRRVLDDLRGDQILRDRGRAQRLEFSGELLRTAWVHRRKLV